MIYLGINGGFGGGYQDIAACFIRDGKIVFAAEEERFNRIKFSPGVLPLLSIKQGLSYLKLVASEIKVVAMHGVTWSEDKESKIKSYFRFHFGISPEIRFYHHHDCHAASVFYTTSVNDALVFSMDSSGDGISTRITSFKGDQKKIIQDYERPQSLGFFYSAITQYCGFKRDADEYKLMGLAPYGKDLERVNLDFFLRWDKQEYIIDEIFFNGFEPQRPAPSRQELLFSQMLQQELASGPYHFEFSNDKIKSLAFSAQKQLEDVLISLVEYHAKETGHRNIAFCGGVANNCVMIGKLQKFFPKLNIITSPFSGDQGISIGAACLAATDEGEVIQPIKNAYLGIDYENDKISSVLKKCKLKYKESTDVIQEAAKMLNDGKIIGWFHGRSEIGPRALGNRSILANACDKGIKDKINHDVKFRESYRPFAPMVRKDDFDNYFLGVKKSYPYMTETVECKETLLDKAKDIVHVDNTARVQTITLDVAPMLDDLLMKTSGLLINTSLNTRNMPMVESPTDAIECFYSTGLDALVIGNFILKK